MISKTTIGVHNSAFIRDVSEEDFDTITSIKNSKTLLTVAPEVIDGETIKKFKAKGIVLSAGHTNATFDEAQVGFNAGITGVTHLYNAMSGLNHRKPGVLGAALSNDNIWAGIIADGYHVYFPAVKIAYKCKGNKLFLVTDAMPPVGMPENETDYIQDGLQVTVKDGVCVNENGTIAGSALDMATAVRNCIQEVGIDKSEALKMASAYPAEFLGIDNQFGFIKPGYKANLAIFDNDIFVKSVILAGKHLNFSDR